MMPPSTYNTRPFPRNELTPASAASTRSSQPVVRNPMLALQEARDAAGLPAEAREALRSMLLAVSKACREKGNKAWRKHKPPMAAYWKSNAVHARHLAHAMAFIADEKGNSLIEESAK